MDETALLASQRPQNSTTKTLQKRLLSLLPLALIAGLLYAALFIKPVVKGKGVPRPVMEKRDRFYGIAMPTAESLWAVGNDGKIVRSEDGGKTWSAQQSGSSANLQAIAAWDKERAVVAGNRGTMLYTSNGGAAWQVASVPAEVAVAKLIRVRTNGAGTGWAVGELGTVLETSDYGKSWKPARIKSEDLAWNDIGFHGSRGCMVGEFGRIRCTSDRGATWLDIESPVKTSLNAIAFRSELDAVAIGLEGALLHTTDGGAHWQAQSTTTDLHLYDVTWDGSRWIAVGDRGVVLVAEGDAAKWSNLAKVIDSPSWHTQVTGNAGRIALAGQGITLAQLDGKGK